MRINTQSTQALNKLADQSRTIRSRFEPQWYLNLAFYLGDQWVYWNRGRLDKPTLEPWRLLITENRIMPIVLTRLAKKTKQRPVWTVIPNSQDDEDISAAQLGQDVLEGLWKNLDMQTKLFQALQWADTSCAGFWKICWDPTAGESVSVLVGADGNPIQDSNGRVMQANSLQNLPEGIKTKTVSQGEVRIEVRSPFEILPDPLGNSIEDCEWIIEEVVQSEEYVRAHHGVELQGDTEVSAGPSDSRFFPSFRLGGSTDYKGIKVRELWLRKCSQYPKGRHTVWARDKVLRDEDNPYEGLPYIMFTGVPVAGRFWPTSIVEQLREPQVELNKIKSQVRENAQRIGNPALLKSRIANVQYSGVPGEEILYDELSPNSVPAYLQPPGMPPYVIEEIDRIENTIREIAGQHEVSQSSVPAGVTAASAINLLLEQDDTRLGPTITELENVLGISGTMVLKLVGQYYAEERMIRLVGEDEAYNFIAFRGQMLRGNTQVEVQAGSQFPASKAARQAAIQQTLTLLIQNGQPIDPRVMRKVLRDYQVGGLEAFFGDVAKDEAQTNREHRLLYQGQPLPINSFDDDDIHIANHEDEMKSGRWFRANQQIQAVWGAHVSMHRQRQMQRQQEALQMQMQMAQAQASTGLQTDLTKISAEHQATMEEQAQQQAVDLQKAAIQFKQRQAMSRGTNGR